MFRLGKGLVNVRATRTLVPYALSAVVDPMEEIEQYIEASEASGMKIIPPRPPQADAIRARNLGVSAPISPAGS